MKQVYALPVIAALLASMAAFPALAAPADGQNRARGGPSAADLNQDGFVDRGEWQKQRDLIFQRLDANQDGRLSRAEMQRNGAKAGAAKAQRPSNSGTSDRPARQDRFTRLDTDGDGFVSRAEFNAASEQAFARCDKNGDGRIAKGECRGGRQRDAARSRTRSNAPVQ